MWNSIIPSKLDTNLTKSIYAEMRRVNTEKDLEHIKSGKLSASKLGNPLLEQMLYVLGVPQRPAEDYSLGQFLRGDTVETSLVGLMHPDETQVEVNYRDTIGMIDCVKDGMPYEIKSIKNSNIKYIDPNSTEIRYEWKDGVRTKKPAYTGVKYAHALQATLYGLATGTPHVTVVYVSAEDFRTWAHVIETDTMKDEVDRIITEFKAHMVSGTLPKWEAREEWQERLPQYSSYPDWIGLDPDTAMKKLQTQFPTSYEKLTKKGK